MRDRVPRVGEPLAPRLADDDDLFGFLLALFRLGVERLALLAAVAIDGEGLEAEFPAPEVCVGDVGRRHVGRHVDRLADRPGEERLSGGHHADVGPPLDAADAVGRLEGTIEDGEVLDLEVGGPFDRVLLVDVLDDALDLRIVVAELGQGERHGLVDDFQHAAAGELLVLHEGDVRLDAGCVAVHHEADRAGRGENRRLSVAIADLLAEGDNFVPQVASRVLEIFRPGIVDLLASVAMHLHDAEHRLAVLVEALERADDRRHFSAGEVRGSVEQCRHRAAHAVSRFAVVRHSLAHEQAAQVRVTEAQRAEGVAITGDVCRRIARVIDQDFLSDEVDAAGGLEPLDVERAVLLAELHQVDAGQVASRVVEEHVLAARIAGVDAAAVRASVPAVDRRVVLHARIAALPGTLGHPTEQILGRPRRAFLVRVGNPVRRPFLIVLDRFHELVGHADREIRVLEEDRAIRLAVEVRFVAPLLNEAVGLLLFLPLALDELHDVRVPDF